MSTSTADAGGTLSGQRDAAVLSRLRLYCASDPSRALQTALGLLWLLDGALQFQSFMYSQGFIDMLTQMLPGQPPWLHDSMRWASDLAAGNLTVYNPLFALTGGELRAPVHGLQVQLRAQPGDRGRGHHPRRPARPGHHHGRQLHAAPPGHLVRRALPA